MSDLPRRQHIIASSLILALGITVAYISFTQEPAQAFLFPRIISIVFCVLAAWTFVKAILGYTKVGKGISAQTMRSIMPGLLVMLVYIFWAASFFGFYSSLFLACFILLCLYDPAPLSDPKVWLKHTMTSTIYIIVMYLLFSTLLNVYAPKGILI